MARPGPIICPLCTQARSVTKVEAVDERQRPVFLLRCDDQSHDVFRWEMKDMEGRKKLGWRKLRPKTSLVERLGLYDKLREVLRRHDGWVEHGVVEHELAEAHPDTYRELVARMGHATIDDDASASASSYLSRLLGTLTRDDEVERREVDATGLWSTNGTISAWRALPTDEHETEPSDDVLSWEEFAEANGIDAGSWPATASFAP